VDRVARGLEIQQFGDGSTSRDYTYIDDIVGGVVRGALCALELASSHVPFIMVDLFIGYNATHQISTVDV
jgi:nucleoside-diphosphate-sugar epimerase